MPQPRSDLATIPHATCTVTNLTTGETEEREPGAWFGLRSVKSVSVHGTTVHIEIGSYLWRFRCDDETTAQKRAHQIAIRAGR